MNKNLSLKHKILFTVLMIVLFRVGSVFPVPFINTSILKISMESVSDTLFGLFNMMSGGGLGQASLFAMGVSPYINASIIIQLLTVALPVFENMKKEGPTGAKKLNQITRAVSVLLALVQSIGFYFMLNNWGALNREGVVPALVIMIAFTAGSSLVMWMGERVTEKGIGNGVSLILVAGILSGLPSALLRLTIIDPKYWIAVIIAVVLVAIVFVVFVNEAELRIPVQYARAVTGKFQNGQKSNLPLKVNLSGVMPIIFASTVLSIPQTIKMFVPSFGSGDIGEKILAAFKTTNPIYGILYFLLIIAFNYFYVSIQYDPVEMANGLKQNGGVIPGIRPGKPTSDDIRKAMSRLTFIGAIFLGIIAAVPIILNGSFQQFSFYLGGTSLLIIVGVAIETVKQMESTQTAKKYSKLI